MLDRKIRRDIKIVYDLKCDAKEREQEINNCYDYFMKCRNQTVLPAMTTVLRSPELLILAGEAFFHQKQFDKTKEMVDLFFAENETMDQVRVIEMDLVKIYIYIVASFT